MAAGVKPTLFGRVRLGYVVIESERLTDWRRFAEDGIGMHVDRDDRDSLRFRLDDHHARIRVQRGPAEDVVAVGWQVDDDTAFELLTSRVADAGVSAEQASPVQASALGVGRRLRVPGPKNLPQEIYTLGEGSPESLRLGASGFVTGTGGMGHIAITSRRPEMMRGYYANLLDARLTDYIDEKIHGVKLKIRFLRLNDRHHSVAVAATRPLRLDPIRTRIQHVNIQVADLEDVSASYERLRALGFSMAWGIGQHTNDRELSYYAITPSGFEWEVGWNPITIDEKTWKSKTIEGISVWGHRPEDERLSQALSQIRRGIASLVRSERTVPAIRGQGIADGSPDPTL